MAKTFDLLGGVSDFFFKAPVRRDTPKEALTRQQTKLSEMEHFMSIGDWEGVVDKLGGNYGPEKKAEIVSRLGQMDKFRRSKLEQEGVESGQSAKARTEEGIIKKLTPQEQKDYMLKPDTQINLGKPAAASERTAIVQARSSIDSLNNLSDLFDKNFVGPIKGKIAPLKGLLELNPVKQEEFMAATFAFKNAIIKQITGAQMSEKEAQRIMKQIPDVTDPPTRWRAKWRQSLKNIQMLQAQQLRVLGESGLRVPGAAASTTPTAPTKPQYTAAEIKAELARRGALK